MPRISAKKDIAVTDENLKKSVEQIQEGAKPKKEFGQTERIKCYSVTQGGLYVDGPKSKQPYSFSDYGDETEIEYRDLVGLIVARSAYIFHPYFIIADKDFVAEFPHLEKFYNDSYDMQDLANILTLPNDQMEEKLKKLPAGAAENLKVIASSQVADGRLDSIRKIKILNEFFGIDLNLVAELSRN